MPRYSQVNLNGMGQQTNRNTPKKYTARKTNKTVDRSFKNILQEEVNQYIQNEKIDKVKD